MKDARTKNEGKLSDIRDGEFLAIGNELKLIGKIKGAEFIATVAIFNSGFTGDFLKNTVKVLNEKGWIVVREDGVPLVAKHPQIIEQRAER